MHMGFMTKMGQNIHIQTIERRKKKRFAQKISRISSFSNPDIYFTPRAISNFFIEIKIIMTNY